MKRISFRLAISQVFIVFTLIVITAVSANFYTRTSQAIVDLAQQVSQRASETIIEQTRSFLNTPASYTRILSKQLELNQDDDSLDIAKAHENLWSRMWEPLLISEQIQSLFIADDKGNYVQVRREPRLATRLIDRSNAQGTLLDQRIYRKENYEPLERESKPTDFDPRIRPWYRNTASERRIQWTRIYVSTTAQTPVIAATYPVLSPAGLLAGVVGVNIPLHSISDFVAAQKVSKAGMVVIIGEKGTLVAHPDKTMLTVKNEDGRLNLRQIPEMNDATITAVFDRYTQNPQENQFSIQTHGESYIAIVRDFPEKFAEERWKIVTILPEADILDNVRWTVLQAMAIAFMILVAASFLVFFIANRISAPLKKLVEITAKFKDFDLNKVEPVKSRFIEIDAMNRTILSARDGLENFQKYVPADLVRQLIQTDQQAKLGGEVKELTFFFSDIAGFTSISEILSPQELLIHLSEYLDELSRIILEEQGTIDKYIGDAIMAFWGAPIAHRDDAYHACLAAIQCQKKLKELNAVWAQEHKPVMESRIGIHTGPAIVGNFGTSQRMNYSAIGDTVNLASRLEGVNKLYGTQIILSEDTYKQVSKHFVCRLLDKVAVKGKRQGVRIYELIAESSSPLCADRMDFCQTYETALQSLWARNWDQAATLFAQLQTEHPNDRSVQTFVKRCRAIQRKRALQPTSQEIFPLSWDGTFALETK